MKGINRVISLLAVFLFLLSFALGMNLSFLVWTDTFDFYKHWHLVAIFTLSCSVFLGMQSGFLEKEPKVEIDLRTTVFSRDHGSFDCRVSTISNNVKVCKISDIINKSSAQGNN